MCFSVDLSPDRIALLNVIFNDFVTEDNKTDEEFKTVVLLEKINSNLLIEALKRNEFSIKLKPYLLDLLNRNQKLQVIRSSIFEIDENSENEFEINLLKELLNDRDILCSLIDLCKSASLPKIGSSIVKTEYPIPLSYYKLNKEKNKLEYKLKFELLSNYFSSSQIQLAVINGTESCIRSGKSKLIPILFPGSPFFQNKQNDPKFQNIDIIISPRNNQEWIIADFSGSNHFLNNHFHFTLLKLFSAFCSVHVLNTKLCDYDEKTGDPCEEIKKLLQWHLNLNNRPFFVIILRDFAGKINTGLIADKLKTYYVNDMIQLLILKVNLNEELDISEDLQLKKLYTDFNEALKTKAIRSHLHSMNDIKNFYEEFLNNESYSNNCSTLLDFEKEIENKVQLSTIFSNLILKNNLLRQPYLKNLL